VFNPYNSKSSQCKESKNCVTGLLGKLSADVGNFIEFIAGVKTTRALQWRSTRMKQLFGIYHHCLVSSFSLIVARLWACRISDRFLGAVAARAPCHAPLYTDPDREAIRGFNLGISRARGVQYRCARFA
jgi:hypothetical protein